MIKTKSFVVLLLSWMSLSTFLVSAIAIGAEGDSVQGCVCNIDTTTNIIDFVPSGTSEAFQLKYTDETRVIFAGADNSVADVKRGKGSRPVGKGLSGMVQKMVTITFSGDKAAKTIRRIEFVTVDVNIHGMKTIGDRNCKCNSQ